tara:strand:- start:33 stop:1061 length:1029 start_codon:yes stop_codon:yes gene_type:complete
MEYPSLGTPPAGSIRFNTDSSKMEIYNGDKWWEIDSTSPYEQTGGTRGLWGGGETPGALNTVEYKNIDSTGDFIDFGNLTVARAATPGCGASRTRAFWAGGQIASTYFDEIDYVTISSTGDALDFGDLQNTRRSPMTASNATRGVILAGTRSGTTLNVNDYITIATTGNAQDFGDAVTTCNTTNGAAMSSPTRGVFAGGYGQPGTTHADCNYITLMTQGKQADFGDLPAAKYNNRGASNAIRGISAGGLTAPVWTDSIDYFTLATLGNGLDFGDLSGNRGGGAAMASSTRGVLAAGYNGSGGLNSCEYVQIMTTGNSVDFGDVAAGAYWSMSGSSNGHGGLG